MTRNDLHRLVDELPEHSFEAAARYLVRVRDPMIAKLDTTPLDDEPFTEEEQAEVERARQRLDRGEGIPLEQLMAELDEAE